MDDREHLISLIINAKRTDPETGSFTEYLADFLLGYGVKLPTLTPPNEWVSVENRSPALPDDDYCSVMVNTAYKGRPKSRPMIYERAIVRGKRVERWKYYWDRIAEEPPDYWMPLPEPPKGGLKYADD